MSKEELREEIVTEIEKILEKKEIYVGYRIELEDKVGKVVVNKLIIDGHLSGKIKRDHIKIPYEDEENRTGEVQFTIKTTETKTINLVILLKAIETYFFEKSYYGKIDSIEETSSSIQEIHILTTAMNIDIEK